MWIYGLVSSVVLWLSFRLFRKASGTLSLSKLNIVSWVFYYYLGLQCFIGINFTVLGIRTYWLARVPDEFIVKAYWAVCYTMVCMPLAMSIFQRVVLGGRVKQKISNFFSSDLKPVQTPKDSALVIYWLILSVIAFLATAYVYYVNKTLPLMELLQSNLASREYARLRIESSWEFAGNVYIKNILCLILAPLTSYVAYGYHRLYPKKYLYRFWFYFSAFVALLAAAHSGAKAPPVFYLVSLFFLRMYTRRIINVRRLVFLSAVTLVLMYMLYGVTSENWALKVNQGMLGRLLIGQISGLPQAFQVFPQHHPFLWGGSFPTWITAMLGVEHARSARIVMEFVNPTAVAQGTAGVINTLYIGEAWANFGWTGLLLAPIIVGFVIQFIYNVIISMDKTPLSIALATYFMFDLPVTGGFVDFIWNAGWIIIFSFFVTGMLFRAFLRLPIKSNNESLPKRLSAEGEL